jgi:hypothetical protein
MGADLRYITGKRENVRKTRNSHRHQPGFDQILLNTQSLGLQHALECIAKVEGPEAAFRFKQSLLDAVKHGSIDMALLEDAAIFDFVVSMIESIPTPDRRPT